MQTERAQGRSVANQFVGEMPGYRFAGNGLCWRRVSHSLDTSVCLELITIVFILAAVFIYCLFGKLCTCFGANRAIGTVYILRAHLLTVVPQEFDSYLQCFEECLCSL